METMIPILIILGIFTFFALAFVYASRVKKVGPNEVLVISGRGERGTAATDIQHNFRIVTGGAGRSSGLCWNGLMISRLR